MGFLDNLGKSVSQGLDRAKFEAEKFQKTSRIQGEIHEIKKQLDAKRLEFGDRAIELYRAGQIQSPTLGDLLRSLDALQQSVTLKEEELKTAQADIYVEPPQASPPQAQSVPISVQHTPQATAAPTAHAQTGNKGCPSCQFQMPQSALFCPNCGTRVGA